MDAEQISIAETCLHAAHNGNLSFPEIIGKLIAADFEGYAVDYRRNTQTFYLPDGDSVVLAMVLHSKWCTIYCCILSWKQRN